METSIFIFGARNKHHHNIAVQHNTARLYYSNTQSWAHAHHNLTAIEGVTAEWTHTHIFTHTHRERERERESENPDNGCLYLSAFWGCKVCGKRGQREGEREEWRWQWQWWDGFHNSTRRLSAFIAAAVLPQASCCRAVLTTKDTVTHFTENGVVVVVFSALLPSKINQTRTMKLI